MFVLSHANEATNSGGQYTVISWLRGEKSNYCFKVAEKIWATVARGRRPRATVSQIFSTTEGQWFDCSQFKRCFYYKMYTTFLNRIQLTIWTICAFRVLNPRQWSLAKQSGLKMWKVMPKVPKQGKSQKGWCNKPTKLQFHFILKHGKFLCSPNTTNQPKSIVELGYMCPRWLFGPPAVTLTK